MKSPQEIRELEAWVDVNVFGNPKRCLHFNVKVLQGSLIECEECHEQFGQTTLCMARAGIPHYTSSERDALLVLEKCRQKCGELNNVDEDWSVRIMLHPEQIGIFLFDFFDGNCRHSFCADTIEELPYLVCLFAKAIFTK